LQNEGKRTNRHERSHLSTLISLCVFFSVAGAVEHYPPHTHTHTHTYTYTHTHTRTHTLSLCLLLRLTAHLFLLRKVRVAVDPAPISGVGAQIHPTHHAAGSQARPAAWLCVVCCVSGLCGLRVLCVARVVCVCVCVCVLRVASSAARVSTIRKRESRF
jgi:hypothetical protein